MLHAVKSTKVPAVREIVAQTKDRHSVLIFASSVDHAARIKETIEKWTRQECGLVTGETPAAERDRILRRFKGQKFAADLLGTETRPLKYLVNVNVLTTGFDAPNIDCIVLLRPTASPGLFVQMLGRGFRLHETNTDCLVLDYGGNILRHGPVDAVQVKDKNGKGGGEAPAKECPKCQSIVHAAVMVCPDCGYEFPVQERETLENTASNEGVLTGEIVDTEYDIEEILYSVHTKRGADENAAKTLRIDYCVGLNNYHSEWVCPEPLSRSLLRAAIFVSKNTAKRNIVRKMPVRHGHGWARKKFEKWWQARSNDPVPDTAELAARIGKCGGIAEAKTILVRKVGGEKFGRIVKYTLAEKPHSVSENFDEEINEYSDPFEMEDEEVPF